MAVVTVSWRRRTTHDASRTIREANGNFVLPGHRIVTYHFWCETGLGRAEQPDSIGWSSVDQVVG